MKDKKKIVIFIAVLIWGSLFCVSCDSDHKAELYPFQNLYEDIVKPMISSQLGVSRRFIIFPNTEHLNTSTLQDFDKSFQIEIPVEYYLDGMTRKTTFLCLGRENEFERGVYQVHGVKELD